MVKLRKIKLEGFRGARLPVELDFTDRNLSIAVYGDNGGGKSTLTDAIEWLYFDKVNHLWREDCKEECLRNTHIPDNQNANVSVQFNNATLNSDKAITSKFRSSQSNCSKDFRDYLEQSKKERLILRYGDILRFVLLTKGEKRAEILSIIGFQHLVDLRSTLVSACNDIERHSRFRSVRDQLTENEAYMMEKLGQTLQNQEDLYLVTSTIIKPLNLGIVIIDENSFNACIEAIKTKSDKIKLEKSNKLSDLKTAIERLKSEVESTKELDAFLDSYAKLLKDKEKIKKIGLRQLLEKGEEVIENQIAGENVCPLCLSAIDSSLVLKDIAARIKELEQVNKEIQAANSNKISALSNLRRIKKGFDDAWKAKIEDDADFTALNNMVAKAQPLLEQALRDVETKFSKLEIIEKDGELFEKQGPAIKEEVDKLLPKIQSKVSALAETESQRLQFEIFDKISNANRIYNENIKLSKELRIFETQLETLTKIKDNFIQLQGRVLQEALNAISSDADRFYRQINPEEGIENIRLELIADEGVEFRYSFHGKESHPPLKYLSESHLHCLGICLFLASVKLFNKKNSFFILDDVITSFDSDHRIPFLRVLQDHFKDYQVVLLTHEKVWYEQINAEMKHAGWLFNDVRWSIDDGIQLKQSIMGIKERLKYKVQNGNFDVGNDLRKLLERVLKEVCFDLEVKMRFLPDAQNERRMIGEMLSELRAKLNREKCSIRNEPILDRLAISSLITTRESHDSPAFASRGDIQQVITDIEDFEALFLCPDCGKYISLEYPDKAGKKVKCRCGKKEIQWHFA